MGSWLEALEIGEPHASGGSATVWRARHAKLESEVALKVLSPEHWQGAHLHVGVTWEARLLARLRHPNVVVMYDYGALPDGLVDVRGRALPTGAPYLALEFASHTLRQEGAATDWSGALQVLRAVLSGLAHTHARGLIHCDLKPENLLCFASGLKISDFGISRWHRADAKESQRDRNVGTPAFMAPEQISHGALGPTTDLYALGCLTYWLVQGAPPFDQGSREDILRGHLLDQPPRVHPRFACPEDLQCWLDALLAKDPLERYSCAADAAVALERLGPLRGSSVAVSSAGLPSSEALAGVTIDVAAEQSSYIANRSARRAPRSVAAFPTDGWRDDAVEEWGLGGSVAYRSAALLGLRTPRMVGRETERQELWRLLGSVIEQRSPRVLLLGGAAGLGKSRLARWVLERALELGLATGMVATHSPVARAGDGLAGALGDLLGCDGQSRGQAIERVRRLARRMPSGSVFKGPQAAALVDIVRQGAATVGSHPDALADGQWLNLVTEFLRGYTHDRPLVLWLDDIQWGLESLVFLEHVLNVSAERAMPLLAVMTLQSHALVDRPLARASLERLLRVPQVLRADLSPLAADEVSELLLDLVPESTSCTQALQRRALGNPLFAVQAAIVSLQRSGRTRDSSGNGPAAESVPETIAQLWAVRVDQFLDEFGIARRDAASVLETLAAACSAVTLEELVAVCEPLSSELVEGLVQQFLRAGFLLERRGVYSFYHGLLRDELCSVARRLGRLAALNLQWAEGLALLYGHQAGWVSERIAHHFFVAGEFQAALHWIPRAAEHCIRLGFIDRAKAILRLRDETLDAVGAADNSVERGHGWLLRVRLSLKFESPATLDEWLARGKTIVNRWGDDELLAHFFLARCHLRRSRDDLSGAFEDGHRAAAFYEGTGETQILIALDRVFGELARKQGLFDQAIEHYRAAALRCEQVGDTFLLSWCRLGMAMANKAQRRFAESDQLVTEALAGFESSGSGCSIAGSLNEKGELARLAGEFGSALVWYRQAEASLPRNHIAASTMRWNIALTLLQQGDFEAAETQLTHVRNDLLRRGRDARLVYPDFGDLVCEAHRRRWASWDEVFGRVCSHVESRVAHSDFGLCATLAAEECTRAGEISRARSAFGLAARQWQSLDLPVEASRARDRAAALTSEAHAP